MKIAFIPSVPLSAGSRPLSPHSSPFSFRPAHAPTTPRHGLFQQSTDTQAPRGVPVASLSRSLSVFASLLSLGVFPADVAAASSALPNSRQQHVEATVQLSSSSSSASIINNGKRSIQSPITLIPPVIATENSSTSDANKSVVNKEAAKTPAAATVQQRCSFYLSEFLMWHPGAKVLTLLAFTLAVMYFGSFLYQFADPNQEEASYPFWHSVRAVANPLEDDWRKNSLRATSITMAAFGMVVFAILVGMVTDSVQSAVDSADGESTHVVVSDHMVVCGWSSHVAQILRDIGSVSPNTKVVVLAPASKKDSMQADIRSTIPSRTRQNLRIYYRPGVPTVQDDLARVGAARAKKILLVKPACTDPIDGDRVTLSRALALRQNVPTFTGDIVAELSNPRDESLLRTILAPCPARSVQTVNSEQLLFRFMAQAIRQPGLADIVAMLMGDDPSSVFHIATAGEAAPELVGVKIDDLRPTSVPGAILCGFVDPVTGRVAIETGSLMARDGAVVSSESKLLLLGRGDTLNKRARGSLQTVSSGQSNRNAEKNNEKELSSTTTTMMQTALDQDIGSAVDGSNHSDKPENFLVLGWRKDMNAMLLELDAMLPHRSIITIVDKQVPDRVPVEMKRVKVKLVRKRADRYETIDEVMSGGTGRRRQVPVFDHVVVIGSRGGSSSSEASESQGDFGLDGNEGDATSLATLVYVNDVITKLGQQHTSDIKNINMAPLITVEFFNDDVANMAREQGGIANAILPQNLGAKIAAQTVRDSRLNGVWSELLSQEGREVYLRPAGMYEGVGGQRASFATVADRVAKSENDIVIGYIPRHSSKVKINPQSNARFSPRMWNAKDTLIVLSKE